MLRFEREQRVYNIGGVEIGGQPGERPAVLIGSIFYARHRIVTDAQAGVFDEEQATALLDDEARVAAFTGNPRFVDPVGSTTEALIRYIDFLASHTSAPILVDSPLQRVRIEAIRHFAGSDIATRLIYNSIAEDRTAEELGAIKDCGIRSAIVLAFSTRAVKPEHKLRLLEDELLPAAAQAGVENVLVDTGVLDVPSVSWSALAIRLVKERLGYPAGCAPANAIWTWEKMKAQGTEAHISATAALLATVLGQGADFLLYGPIRTAPWVYPAVATANALMAYGGRFVGTRPQTEGHPLYKVF